MSFVCYLNYKMQARKCKTRTHLQPKLLKNVVDQKNWFVGRVYKMRGEFGNHWVVYRDPINLMDSPSNMDIGSCWYQNGQKQVNLQLCWSFNDKLLMILLIFWKMIALPSMTYIIDLMIMSYIEGMKKPSTTYMMNAKVLQSTHDRGCMVFKSIFVYLR